MSDELLELEERWARIVLESDRAGAEELLAADFVLTSAGGVSPHMPRDDWLAALGRIRSEQADVAVHESRVFGDVAVVRATLSWRASLGERDLSGDYVVADVFTRANGRWQASWRISTRVSER